MKSNIIDLSKALKSEIIVILKDMLFCVPGSTTKIQINVYEQYLPIAVSSETENNQEELENGLLDDVTENEPVPYALIVCTDGKNNTCNEAGSGNIELYFCIYDTDEMRAGYQSLVSIITKICTRFQKNPWLHEFMVKGDIDWALDEKENHPYYMCGLHIEFQMPAVRRELGEC